MQPGLAGLLRAISTPHQPGSGLQYYVKPIPGFKAHYFGYTSDGSPCLLLNTKDNSIKAPIRLTAIEVSFAIPCQIALADGNERTETLTAIICKTSDQVVHSYFIHVCETILHIVGISPNLQKVIEAVQHLVDLFQKLARSARRSTIGLFGELYTIYTANSPMVAVSAWRNAIDDRFDFSIDDVRLEVKASSARQRAHNFSLEQCNPPPDTTGVLISLFVETSGGGLSLLELIDRVERKLDGNIDLIMKFQETVAEGLGSTASSALSIRFDEELAQSSLQIYTLASIPAIRNNLPTEISQVKFRSDLSHTQTANKTALISQSKKLEELLPQ